MEDLTPMEQTAETTDRMIAAMMTFTADAMEPDSDDRADRVLQHDRACRSMSDDLYFQAQVIKTCILGYFPLCPFCQVLRIKQNGQKEIQKQNNSKTKTKPCCLGCDPSLRCRSSHRSQKRGFKTRLSQKGRRMSHERHDRRRHRHCYLVC